MRDPRIKMACPFCGETEHLDFSDNGGLLPMIVDGAVVERANGYEQLQEVDAVYCDVCGANAPLITWNRELTGEMLAALRDIDAPAQEVAA